MHPEYRHRLVAKDFKRDNRKDLFAATPPLEALKMLISMWMAGGIGWSKENPDHVMDFIDNQSQPNLNTFLFINAWDPHSILGHGNFDDDSLDGNFGRRTPISLLGWPATNPHISYHKINFKK